MPGFWQVLSAIVQNVGAYAREHLLMPAIPAEPVYRRIMRDILDKIDRGELQPGSRLPSISQFTEQYRCSAPTVRQAVARLQERGVLQGHQGRGVYVTPAPD
jgi:DNA-binding GntR family transcriptional regulator